MYLRFKRPYLELDMASLGRQCLAKKPINEDEGRRMRLQLVKTCTNA